MTTAVPRFGIWALVHGSRGAYQDPDEPYDAWERNRALVLAAEQLGFDSVLIAQHTINPHIADFDQLEAWSAAAALAALTSRIEIIAAIKPYLYHPVFFGQAGARNRKHQPRTVCDQSRQRLEFARD
jgi:alkanesulfonate monooxygenase